MTATGRRPDRGTHAAAREHPRAAAPTPVLEVGGTHVTAALVQPDGTTVTDRLRRPLASRGSAEEILGGLLGCARSLAAPPGAVWGVAVPGPFDYARGIALFEGVGKFEALYGVDVGAVLRDGLPQRPSAVRFRNDAHAFLAGEWHAGAARGHRRCVGITLGTGVGSAFLADGRLCREGPGVPPQGVLHLTELNGRPLEESVSRRALVARYGQPEVDVQQIAERARAGEERARRVLDDAFTALGGVLAPRLAAFGASALVVGGSVTGSWDLVGPALRAGLGDTPVTVRTSALAEDAALVGAARATAPDGPAPPGAVPGGEGEVAAVAPPDGR